jgi:hypothetical protein
MLANPINKSHEDFVEMLYDTLCERVWDNLFENNFPGQCGDALLRADDTFIRELTGQLLEDSTFIERATEHIYQRLWQIEERLQGRLQEKLDNHYAVLTAKVEKLEGFVREAMKADHN